MADLSLASVVVAAPNQVHCQVGDEVVLLHLESAQYYGLNTVGARIWSLLQEPIPLHRVRDALVAEFDVAPDACERDLLALVEQLRRAGLAEIRDAAAA